MAAHRTGGSHARSLGTSVLGVAIGFVAVIAVIGALLLFRGGTDDKKSAPTSSGPTHSGTSASTPADIPAPVVDAATRRALPRADTFHTISKAGVELDADSKGRAVHVVADLVAFAQPGKTPIALVPAKQFGSETWLPIIGSDRNWLQVRLPARPNGAVAWIERGSLPVGTTAWAVDINLEKQTMTITKGGQKMGSWPVGIGMSSTPTPTGQTFVLGSFVDPKQSFSPVIYATGAHSDTLDTFGGGPGTVAIHGWPNQAGRTGKISHGCVRVPGEALAMFAKLPAATPINITS